MEENLLQTAEKLARASMSPTTLDGAPFMVVPNGHTIQSLEPFLQSPARKRQKVTLHTLESFVRYVNRFKADGQTAIFADQKANTLCAVFDYHEPGPDGARWGDHRATLSPRFGDAFLAWFTKDAHAMPQAVFADFLEDRAADVASPSAAEMLDIARTLQATISVNFRKGVRLDNSTEQLSYEQTVDAKAGQRGELAVPTEFILILPIYEGHAGRTIPVRLRYKIAEGHLSFTYIIARKAELLNAEWISIVEVVQEKTGVEPFMGS